MAVPAFSSATRAVRGDACAKLRQLVPEPADRERADGNGMLADSLHPELVYGRDVRAAPRPRRSARAGRAHAGLVHAPGGPLAAGVPRDPRRRTRCSRSARAGALRRGDAAAGAPPRRRRGGDVRGHHAAAARDGGRRRARRERRARVREPIASAADVERAARPEPEEAVPSILEAIAHRAARAARRPGGRSASAAAPFTVAGYLVEGKPSREFAT